MPEYKWKPIEDLPENLYSYSDSNLRKLEEEWKELKSTISDDIQKSILDEIKRQWAIETGKVEGLYTLSKGITETFIKDGIQADIIREESTNRGPKLVGAMILDQEEVLEGLFDVVAHRKELTLSYIKSMHQVFTRHQDLTEAVTSEGKIINIPLLKGDWKRESNSPLQNDKTIHEYCPPLQVQNEMEKLFGLYLRHKELNLAPEVRAAFLHHRFTQIHPFQDGNGRIARALASLIFICEGDFPLVVNDDERSEYFSILEYADFNNIRPLIDFMVNKQKDLLYSVIKRAKEEEFKKNLSLFETRVDTYIDDFSTLKEQVNSSNAILNMWKDSLYEIVGSYEEKLKEKGLLQDSVISHVSAGSRQVSTSSTSSNLGSSPQIIGAIKIFSSQIRFPNQKQGIAIEFNVSNVGREEILLHATMIRNANHVVDPLEVSSNEDYRLADLTFREWFISSFNSFVQEWLNV